MGGGWARRAEEAAVAATDWSGPAALRQRGRASTLPMMEPAVALLTSRRTVRLLSPASIPRFGRFVGPSSSSEPSCGSKSRAGSGHLSAAPLQICQVAQPPSPTPPQGRGDGPRGRDREQGTPGRGGGGGGAGAGERGGGGGGGGGGGRHLVHRRALVGVPREVREQRRVVRHAPPSPFLLPAAFSARRPTLPPEVGKREGVVRGSVLGLRRRQSALQLRDLRLSLSHHRAT